MRDVPFYWWIFAAFAAACLLLLAWAKRTQRQLAQMVEAERRSRQAVIDAARKRIPLQGQPTKGGPADK